MGQLHQDQGDEHAGDRASATAAGPQERAPEAAIGLVLPETVGTALAAGVVYVYPEPEGV